MWTKLAGMGFCMRNGAEGASGVVMHGGMGSGSIFSSVLKGSSASVEASDMWMEKSVYGRVKEG